MNNRNPYFDDFFKQIAEPDETYHYYFYVIKLAPLTKHVLHEEFL